MEQPIADSIAAWPLLNVKYRVCVFRFHKCVLSAGARVEVTDSR
jgi:hypothetical protein